MVDSVKLIISEIWLGTNLRSLEKYAGKKIGASGMKLLPYGNNQCLNIFLKIAQNMIKHSGKPYHPS
jgi:hypothetical protein